MQEFDDLILGGGLAGTTLAWQLRRRGRRVLLIDREAPITSSRVAAGLITPITGMRLVKTPRYEVQWEAACAHYRAAERETGGRFFHERRMLRLFSSDEESRVLAQRLEHGDFRRLVTKASPVIPDELFKNSPGGFEMCSAGQLDVPGYLDCSREFFRDRGCYREADVDLDRDVELEEGGVLLPRLDVRGTRLLFCQGIDGRANPWFADVPFDPAKGEILTLRIDDFVETRAVHHGVWLAPAREGLWKSGATFDRERLDRTPTDEGRNEITEQLSRFLKADFDVVEHVAAIRPIVRGRTPVMGLHAEHGQLGLFNGLAAKGSLFAPWFAGEFAGHLVDGKPIEPEFDLCVRCERHRGRVKSSEPRPVRLTRRAHEIVGEALRPGDVAIDATAGNGHDTLFLARGVTASGRVYAFDVQEEALSRTEARLEEAGLREQVTLLARDHAELAEAVPEESRGQVGAAMFNLGYLPGGDKSVTTSPGSTRRALEAAFDVLRPGGVMTVLSYVGHAGGLDEDAVVREWLDGLPANTGSSERIESSAEGAPRLYVVRKEK